MRAVQASTKTLVTLGAVAVAAGGLYWYMESSKKAVAAARAATAAEAELVAKQTAAAQAKTAALGTTEATVKTASTSSPVQGLNKENFIKYFRYIIREMERALLQIMQAAQLLELQMQSEGRAPMTQDQMSQMWNTQVGGAVAKITAAANTQFKVTEQEIELFANMHENDMEVKQQITNLQVLMQAPQSVLPVEVPASFTKETMLSVCEEILELTSKAVEDEVVRAKAAGKDLKDQTVLMGINHSVQAKVEAMKTEVHKSHGIGELEHHAEVIIQSALQKFQNDPDFATRIESMDRKQKERMGRIFEG